MSNNSDNFKEKQYAIPSDEEPYMVVSSTETKLVLKLGTLFPQNEFFTVTLDKKILPHLVDALIEIQNEKN